MNILADENVHGLIVTWLEKNGIEVMWATRAMLGENDDVVLNRALRKGGLSLPRTLILANLFFIDDFHPAASS